MAYNSSHQDKIPRSEPGEITEGKDGTRFMERSNFAPCRTQVAVPYFEKLPRGPRNVFTCTSCHPYYKGKDGKLPKAKWLKVAFVPRLTKSKTGYCRVYPESSEQR